MTIELENEPPDVHVLVNPIRLSHLFQNLVYNASPFNQNSCRRKINSVANRNVRCANQNHRGENQIKRACELSLKREWAGV